MVQNSKPTGKITPQSGLGTIKVMAEVLGNPQDELKIVHIAGTNGKGSCTAMLASVLQKAGYRVGVFTSPHLQSYTERIRINDELISQEEFIALHRAILAQVEPILWQKGMASPKEFELTAMMALAYFAREKVDLVLMEVGLGGRLDATNIVNSMLSIIMSIGLDHCAVLGGTVEEIASEKAGIIKPHVPVVAAMQREAGVMEVLKSAALSQESPLLRADEADYHILVHNETGQIFDLSTPKRHYDGLKIPLLGKHQVENAATVVVAAEALQQMGWSITPDNIREGLAQTVWPGRMEYWPLEGKGDILLDGAHNFAGVQVLTQGLADYFAGRPCVFLLGILDDKDQRDMLKLLLPYGEQVIVTRPTEAEERTVHWAELAKIIGEIAPDLPVMVIESIPEAIEKGLSLLEADGLLCITGSLHLLGECRNYLLARQKKG